MIDGVPLIDAHVHAPALEGLKVPWTDWTGGFPSGEATRALYENGLVVPERFHAYLEQEGVDIALVFAEYSPKVTGIQPVEDILPLVEHDPGRVRLVANLNPHLHHPVTDELERQLALGAVALKIHPVHGAFPSMRGRSTRRTRSARSAASRSSSTSGRACTREPRTATWTRGS